MDNELKENIVIVGMPGSGKSVIGKLLAKEINYDFCDMDEYINEISGKTVIELFEEGEDYFRDFESKACEELANRKRLVIASGGGVIKRGRNIEALKEKGLIVFLNRPIENILSDLEIGTRPLLKGGKEKIFNLYNERYELYKESAHIEVINNGPLKDTVKLIEESLMDKVIK